MLHHSQPSWKVVSVSLLVTLLLFNSGFLVLLTPFPIFYATMLYGRKLGRATVLLAVGVIGVVYFSLLPLISNLSDHWSLAKLIFMLPGAGLKEMFSMTTAQVVGVVYFLYFMLFSVLFSEAIFRKWSLIRTFVVPTIAAFVLVLMASFFAGAFGFSMTESIDSYIRSVFNEVMALQEAAGEADQKLFMIKNHAEDIIAFAQMIIPSMIFLFGAMIVLINQLLARWMLKKMYRVESAKELYALKAPPYLVWAVIVAGFLVFLNIYLLQSVLLRAVLVNALIVLGGIFFIQGLIILAYILGFIRARFLKLTFYILLFMFIQVAMPIMAIIGFTDYWFDYRRFVKIGKNKSHVVGS